MYGVKIGPDQGIVQERYDKLSRSIWNADEFRMQKGDGNGSYEDVLFFDPVNREYEFSGIVRAGQFIGGSIEIGSNFSVDESGHMIAEGAEFSGDITASTITGSDIIGGTGTITSNTDINISRDIRVGNNIFLGLPGQTNDRRIEFVDSGPYRSYIGFTNTSKQLELYAGNDIRIRSGLDVFIDALSATLPSYSYLGSSSSDNRIVSASEAAYNMTFDPNTRNLKLWSRSGDLLAQVNIP